MSTSLGRLQAALAAATNEVTVAAANINFDFTLVKYEAPKEFKPLGELLTSKRKDEAENGRSHITARRLGALFDGVCPDTPNLIKAYGTRVAEVSKQAVDNEPKEYRDSIFSAYTGVDGTSIWAAATSSKTAIHVHMLACMLAEFWDPPEAVSIWDELVAERRRDIAARLEQGEPMHFGLAAAAAQQDISRPDLAAWDASARAWIQTARAAMRLQYTQLNLILKNIDTLVHEKTTVFSGVTEAWRLSLETMEKLVSSIPQEVRIGAAVLGISAWHIYPDMHIFGATNMEVPMNDPLVQRGGILSLGCSSSNSRPGVHWSLCLNHFKFYGRSVQREQSLQEKSNLVPFQNFHHAVVGAILSKWKISTEEVSIGLQVFVNLCSLLSENLPGAAYPINSTRKAAHECLVDPTTQVFFNYGRRKSQFLYDENRDGTSPLAPYFGLTDPRTLFACIPEPNDQVELLRHLAARVEFNNTDVVIYDVANSSAYAITSHTGPFGAKSFNKRTARKRTRSQTTIRYDRWELKGPQLNHTSNGNKTTFDFWFGDITTAAIFQHPHRLQPCPVPPSITSGDLHWCLEHDILSGRNLVKVLRDDDSVLQAISQIYFAAYCFNKLRTVKVDIRSLERPLLQQRWTTNKIKADLKDGSWHSSHFWDPQHVDQSMKRWIQVIASLVAGINMPKDDIPPRITGISTGDSLIVPSRLLKDPSDVEETTPFTRILGNVGRPGFILLSSPEEPILAPLDTMNWKMCNMNPFNGKSEGMLNSTSLHLSFTDWSRPLGSTTTISGRDVHGLVMESVVSIREHGRWVGDIDPASALQSPIVCLMRPQEPCAHPPNEPPSVPMTAVECWDELRDCPEQLVVVKAHGNWVARLAATAYLVECSKKTPTNIKRITVCPQKVCWVCLKPEFASNIYIY